MKAIRTVILAALMALSMPAHAQKQSFDISAGGAAKALREFGRQAGVQLLFDFQAVDGVKTRALTGNFEVEDALRLLLEGTGLSFGRVNERTLAIHPPANGRSGTPANTAPPPAGASAPAESEGQSTGRLELARAESPASQEKSDEEAEHARRKAAQEAQSNLMVVTGTNIRGGGPVGQQVEVITREDIARAGIDNLNELRNLVTQHFGGGGADPIIFNLAQNSAATTSGTNSTYNSSFNLRGLGTGATLTLLNGRRVAPSGSNDTFGVRAIPLNVVERVEIVPDGGSAVYGSDAVGGVVNVITRKDFSGMEGTARYGSVTSGGYTQSSADALAGHSWGSGNAVLYMNYADEGRLTAGERDFITLDFVNRNTTLLPQGHRKGVFTSVSQSATPQLQLGLDVLWSEDNTVYDLDPNLLDEVDPGRVRLRSRASHASLRADYSLSEQWGLMGRVDHSVNENIEHSDNELAAPPEGELENVNTTFELSLSGPVMQLPAGPAQMAVGGLLRKQEFTQDSGSFFAHLERDVTSAYGELLIPLANTLKLNLAARWDDYENGDSRVTPKYGISWQANDSIALRASYSEAFRAPALPQSRDSQRLNFQVANWIGRPPGEQDPRLPNGLSYAAVFIRTGNPDLLPESATIFTTGFDLKPVAVPRLRIGVTYFDIQYQDIILSIFPNRLNNPAFADFVTPRPGAALLQSLMAEAEAVGNLLSFPPDLNAVQVLLDGGAHNVAALETSGFDINARYGFDLGPGTLNLGVKSSYIVRYVLQATRLSARANNVDRVGDPLRLSVRGTASYSLGGWIFSAGTNYAGSYTDDIFSSDPPAPQPIDSMTTFDLGLYYDGSTASAPPPWAKTLSVSLNVRNVADKEPPYVQDFLGFNFDASHGDPVGRFVSLQLTKQWGR